MAYFDITCTNCDSLCNCWSFISGKGNASIKLLVSKIIESSRSFYLYDLLHQHENPFLRRSYYLNLWDLNLTMLLRLFQLRTVCLKFEAWRDEAWPNLTAAAQKLCFSVKSPKDFHCRKMVVFSIYKLPDTSDDSNVEINMELLPMRPLSRHDRP